MHSATVLWCKIIQYYYKRCSRTLRSAKKSSESGFLHEKSSNSSETHITTISSILEATGKIDTDLHGDAMIIVSHLISGQDINVMGESVTIVGMIDHHSSHLQTHATGFDVGSGKNFVSIYGSETKTKNKESFEHQGSSLNVNCNINITLKKKDVSVVDSDLAGKGINLSAAHDVNVFVGHNNHSSSTQEERTGFGFQFEKSNGASIGVWGYECERQWRSIGKYLRSILFQSARRCADYC